MKPLQEINQFLICTMKLNEHFKNMKDLGINASMKNKCLGLENDELYVKKNRDICE